MAKKSQSSSSKRKRSSEEERERRLVASLFGGIDKDDDHDDDDDKRPTTTTWTKKSSNRHHDPDKVDDSHFGIEIDRVGDATTIIDPTEQPTVNPLDHVDDEEEENVDVNQGEEDDQVTETVAWMDQDDEDIDNVDMMGSSSRVRKLRKNKMETIISGTEYRDRLRDRFVTTASLSARVDWANIPEDSLSKKSTIPREDDKMLSSSAPLLSSSSYRQQRNLPRDIINMERCWFPGDIRKSRVSTVHFHPYSDPEVPILLTAGLDKSLQFFRILGNKKSEKIHGIHFPKLPIMSAFFLGEQNVVVSGRRPFFYLYDSIAGKLSEHRILGRSEKSWERAVPSADGRTVAFLGNDGYVVLWDAHTKSVRSNNTIKLNGSVRAVTFTPDYGTGTYLYASGSDGDVYVFDTRKANQCVERFANADGTITSSLAVSPSNIIAVGAESGVVNLYNHDQHNDNRDSEAPGQLQNRLSPFKSLFHITTGLDQLRFNDDGKILAFSSCRERDSLRLLHVESRTVFSNWPTSKTPLGYVYSMDFSPQSKFLAIGNDKGNCLLYQLNHYCSEQ